MEIKRDFTQEDIGKEVKQFEAFAMPQNMVQVAVAFVLGGAFNKLVTAISSNLIMPLVNLVLSSTGGGWRNEIWKPIPNLSIEVGAFAGSLVDFLLTAIVLYILYVKIAQPVFYGDNDNQDIGEVPICTPQE